MDEDLKMASFVIPEVLDNLVGWGPASDAVPEELKYLVRPKFSSTAAVLLWLCRGCKALSCLQRRSSRLFVVGTRRCDLSAMLSH